MNNLLTKLQHLFSGYVFNVTSSGMLPFKVDKNLFNVSWLGLGEYTPLSSFLIIKTESIKDQNNYNDCVWNATTVQKEVDEKVVLSVRSIVSYGNKNGLITDDGFAQIDAGQKALTQWGIVEESILNNDTSLSFYDYTNIDLNLITNNANNHKIKTYWGARNRDDILRLLDQGRALVTGIDWYTGFNQGGGFSAPWLITNYIGWKIGGHSFVMIGYNLNYQGKKVYIFQNSYGELWGDNGKFYIDMDFFDKEGYFCYANLDITLEEVNLIKLKNMFTKIARADDGGIWFIKNGGKQQITTLKQLTGALVDEVGVKLNNLTKEDLTKYKDTLFFGQ